MKMENSPYKKYSCAPHLNILDKKLEQILIENKNELYKDCKEFLFAPSKRIRPAFCYLINEMLNKKIDDTTHHLALCSELLHSATLVHDDIIDKSKYRRNFETFNLKFGEKKAVIVGDYFLSLSLLELAKMNNQEALNNYSKNVLNTINGEINQFNKENQYTDVEDYYKKSANKTSSIFMFIAQTLCDIHKAINHNDIVEFARLFGLIFQLKNDLKSIEEDFQNGTYTLALLYLKQENPNCDIINLDDFDIEKYVLKSECEIEKLIQKAQNLLKNYDNQYKNELISIIREA